MNDIDVEPTVGERVLIVEDDPATRSGLAELVQAWGFQTAEAADGEEAMRKPIIRCSEQMSTIKCRGKNVQLFLTDDQS